MKLLKIDYYTNNEMIVQCHIIFIGHLYNLVSLLRNRILFFEIPYSVS